MPEMTTHKRKIRRISDHFGLKHEQFERLGVLDAFIGLDTHLFADPYLLRKVDIPEFKNAKTKIEQRFRAIATLLSAVITPGDIAWRKARQLLTFREMRGASIGYSTHGNDGTGIGPHLANRLLATASEIISMGIKDPEVFELLGLFEDDFGADRLSDMTLSIIREDVYAFSQRVAKDLGLKGGFTIKTQEGNVYNLALHPEGGKPLIFLPKKILRSLPVALSWHDIDHVVMLNQSLRDRLNAIIGREWKKGVKVSKSDLKALLLQEKSGAYLRSLIEAYKNADAGEYDFDADPSGELSWQDDGARVAQENPVKLSLVQRPTLPQVEAVVDQIIAQFKRNIESNGVNKLLYVGPKLRHEKYTQLLFYTVADSYCRANNLDLSPEVNSGSGAVDFKISAGYEERVVVEIKLSSNPHTAKGYQNQLPAYQAAEAGAVGRYVILRTTESESQIKLVKGVYDKAVQNGLKAPEVFVIDARLRQSASRR